MYAPDILLLDWVYQPIADKVMDRTDHSCYWLAEKCANGAAGGTVIYAVFDIATKPNVVNVCLDLLIVGIWIVMGWRFATAARAADTRWRARQAADPSAIRRFERVMAVLLFVWVLVVELLHPHLRVLVDLLPWYFYVSYFFFMSCLPKPPRRQKAKIPTGLLAVTQQQ